jgi:hypothetical protein
MLDIQLVFPYRHQDKIEYFLNQIVSQIIGMSKLDSNYPTLPAQLTIKKNFTVNPTLVAGVLGSGSLDTEETRSGMDKSTLFERSELVSPSIVNENEGIALIQDSYASNGKINMLIYFNIGE